MNTTKQRTGLLMLIVALSGLLLTALPVTATPGAFDFVTANPIPDGTTYTSFITEDLLFDVTDPGNETTSVSWYLWEGTTPGTPGSATAAALLVQDGTTLNWSFTLPANDINNLQDGDYVWDIIAEDLGGFTANVTGAPFTFTVNIPGPGPFDFVGGNPVPATIDMALGGDVTVTTTNPTGAESVAWYLWTGNTPGNLIDAVSTVSLDYDSGQDVWIGTLSASVINNLADGDYVWTIFGFDSFADTTPINGAPFALTIDLTAGDLNATRIFPAFNATVDIPAEAMIFEEVLPNITWYQLLVVNANAITVYEEWIETATSCLGGTCVAFPPSFINGDYTWYINAFDGANSTGYDTGTAFTIDAPAPVAPVINAPMTTEQNVPTEPVRHVVWGNQPAAQFYYILLTDSAANAIVDVWMLATDVCAGDLCSMEAPLLYGGDYTLLISAWGPGTVDLNNSTTIVDFSLPTAAPMDFSLPLTNPSDGSTVNFNEATLTWDDTVDALWYRLVIVNTSGTGVTYSAWINGGDVCAAGTCFVETNLPNGAYTVWLAAWGPANVILPFTATSFTVNAGL